MTRKLVLGAAMVLGLGLGGAALADTFDPIKTRQAGQDLLLSTFAGVKAVITLKGDIKSLEGPGKAIQRWALVFPTLFPAGTDKGDTKAAPAIWTDQAGFQKDAEALSAAGGKLAVAAKAGDETAVAAAYKEIGEACGACHKDFRLK
jgi:cytochrome c556